LPEGKKRGPFTRFFAQFNKILVYVLLGAGFTKLMRNMWVDAATIFGIVIYNALLGFNQEGSAGKALDSIRNMLSAEARTVGGGEALGLIEQLIACRAEYGRLVRFLAWFRTQAALGMRNGSSPCTGNHL
jgi:hypothetical protein